MNDNFVCWNFFLEKISLQMSLVPTGKAFIYSSSNFVWRDEYKLKNSLGSREVCVKVIHAALNPIDYKVPEILPFWLMFKGQPIGHDVCGTVVSVGSSVTQFEIGDTVFGVAPACCEYTVASEEKFSKVPNMGRGDTAVYSTLPGAGCTALHMLERSRIFDTTDAKRIVVIGASGGVGSCLVQIAKHRLSPGSRIIGVCSKKSAEYVKSIGATEIVDYTIPSFRICDSIPVESVDAVFDTVTSPDDPDYVTDGMKLLKPSTGRYIAINTKSQIEWIRAGIARQTGFNILGSKQYELIMVNQSKKYLDELGELVNNGVLKINIQKQLPFTESGILEGFALLKERHVRGKVVVRISSDH